jgi:hypothetical protein
MKNFFSITVDLDAGPSQCAIPSEECLFIATHLAQCLRIAAFSDKSRWMMYRQASGTFFCEPVTDKMSLKGGEIQ